MKRFLLLLCLLLGLVSSAEAQRSPSQTPPLVVILLPETSLQSWQVADAPQLHRLMASGALAVMNTRTARLSNDHARETPESACLTLGAGARAAGGPEANDFLPPTAPIPGLGVSAGDLYTRRTARQVPPGNSVNVHWPAVLSANEQLGYRLRLGALADALAAKGVMLSAGGGPFADCVAARSDGTVRRDTALTAIEGDCLIWDAGSDIPAADGLIGRAAAQVARLHGRLIVLSPFAGDQDYARGERLTPILECGDGVETGLLRSPSTHRAGLVVNTDFAPTVGAYYGIHRENFAVRPFGDVWVVIAGSEAASRVRDLEGQAVRQGQGMKVLPYLAVTFAAWMLLGTTLAFRKRLPELWPIAPLAFLLALVFSVTASSLLVSFGLLFALTLLVTRQLGPHKVSLLLMAALAAALFGDLLTGGRLMQRGLLGYSAIEGARYYGIGNEAMGVLIGALLVLTARLWRPFGRARWSLPLLLAVTALLLGSANAGAKAGGLLVSLAAFSALSFSLLGGRWSVRVVLLLGLSAVVALTVAVTGEGLLGHGTHSHMGEAVRRIQTGGWSEAGDIVARKLAVEGRLAFHSAWACPLWGGLLCLLLIGRQWRPSTPEDGALRVGGMVGIAACVMLNDAGVVAGALCLLPIWCDSVVGTAKRKPPEQQRLFRGSSSGTVITEQAQGPAGRVQPCPSEASAPGQ